MHTVYVLEPQALFIPELSRIVAMSGGWVTRVAERLDIGEIASLRADYGLLDFDYTPYGVLDGLAFFRGLAADVKPIVLTDERDFEQLERYRAAGAIAVLPKTMAADELCDTLQNLFEGDV